MRTLAIAILLLLTAAVNPRPEPWVMMATELGAPAYDGFDGEPGNPFATAFIELLRDRELTVAALGPRLRQRTQDISDQLQTPDIVPSPAGGSIRLGQASPEERRVALVLINAQYNAGLPMLPGATHDASRVQGALIAAGFETHLVLDGSRQDIRGALTHFASESAKADVALIYSTGHGVFHGDEALLLDLNFSNDTPAKNLLQSATTLGQLSGALKGRQANLLFFGACRTFYET